MSLSTEKIEMKELLILGAGGHAKVVIDTARKCGYCPSAVFDDDETLIGTSVSGVPVVGKIHDLSDNTEKNAFIAIGSNKVRQKLAARFFKMVWPTLIHPNAYVAPGAKIGPGSLVCAGAIIQPDAAIGSHSIVNTGAKVDHDCLIGDFVHICPGCNLAGAVKVDHGSLLGVGCSVIPLISIGAWCTIGAGSVVVRDVVSHQKAMGVPARIR